MNQEFVLLKNENVVISKLNILTFQSSVCKSEKYDRKRIFTRHDDREA